MAARNSFGHTAADVDRAHLERLATRFGAHFLIHLIDIFIDQGRERLAAAEKGIVDGDASAIVAAAHALKSSAGNLGASSLGDCAAEIERRGLAGATAEMLAPLVTTLSERFGGVSTSLGSIRGDIERRTA